MKLNLDRITEKLEEMYMNPMLSVLDNGYRLHLETDVPFQKMGALADIYLPDVYEKYPDATKNEIEKMIIRHYAIAYECEYEYTEKRFFDKHKDKLRVVTKNALNIEFEEEDLHVEEFLDMEIVFAFILNTPFTLEAYCLTEDEYKDMSVWLMERGLDWKTLFHNNLQTYLDLELTINEFEDQVSVLSDKNGEMIFGIVFYTDIMDHVMEQIDDEVIIMFPSCKSMLILSKKYNMSNESRMGLPASRWMNSTRYTYKKGGSLQIFGEDGQ